MPRSRIMSSGASSEEGGFDQSSDDELYKAKEKAWRETRAFTEQSERYHKRREKEAVEEKINAELKMFDKHEMKSMARDLTGRAESSKLENYKRLLEVGVWETLLAERREEEADREYLALLRKGGDKHTNPPSTPKKTQKKLDKGSSQKKRLRNRSLSSGSVRLHRGSDRERGRSHRDSDEKTQGAEVGNQKLTQ